MVCAVRNGIILWDEITIIRLMRAPFPFQFLQNGGQLISAIFRLCRADYSETVPMTKAAVFMHIRWFYP
jgi:hypothetical protein